MYFVSTEQVSEYYFKQYAFGKEITMIGMEAWSSFVDLVQHCSDKL